MPAKSKKSAKAKKKAASKSSVPSQNPVSSSTTSTKQAVSGSLSDEDEDDSVPALEDIDSFPASPPLNFGQGHANSVNPYGLLPSLAASLSNSSNTSALQSAFPHATQQELLATANELYKQIEQAAAAALASSPASNRNATSAPGDESDDAYWLSLPSHLRSFIKNALPLAAGLAPPPMGMGQNGNPSANAAAAAAAAHALNLSPEQMHQAAQQLAQVVQSTGWASVQGGPGHQSQRANANNMTTTTIPLGSFTLPLPLHTHPDHNGQSNQKGSHSAATVTAQAHSAEFGVVEFTDEEDFDSEEEDSDHAPPQRSAPSSQPQQQAKKKGKETSSQSSQNAQGKQAAKNVHPQPGSASKQAAPPARAAVPVVPQLANPASQQANSAKRTNASAPAPAAVRPANATAQAAAMRDRQAASTAKAAANKAANTEREKIRDFWLGLSESERRALVKVEKESVLRKMKDQQRHGCSCAVCGRKRMAIEEELQVLYDAYYEELEQYAYQQQRYASSGGAIPPPPGPGPFPGSVDTSLLPSQVAAQAAAGQAVAKKMAAAGRKVPAKAASQPAKVKAAAGTAAHSPTCPHHHHHHLNGTKCSHGHVHHAHGAGDHADEESEEDASDEDEDDYDSGEDESEEDSQDGYDEEEYEEEAPLPRKVTPKTAQRSHASNDVFGGSSLAAKNGGILTVADDLLKNDGQKFLEMMESLADKRIQRERDAAENELLDDVTDEEDEEEYDDEDDEDEDEEDDDDEQVVSDEQRMEEGRRMFQVFAARMFEQRVLQAYREKVAQERQTQLLRELEAEDAAAAEKDAKKAKEAQKKKDKKRAQKEKQEADRLRREAEKRAAEKAAAEAAAAKAEADRKRAAEQQRKEEEKRKQKEAEAIRREEEKQRRKQEQERQARERREKEEKAKADREAKLAREREAKAKEKAERERKEAERKEAQRLERETSAKRAAEEEKEALRVKNAATAALKAQQAARAPVKAPPVQPRSVPLSTPRLPNGPAQRVPSLPNGNSAIGTKPSSTMAPNLVLQNPNLSRPNVPAQPGAPNRTMPPVQVPVPMYARPPSSGPLQNPMSPIQGLMAPSNQQQARPSPIGPPPFGPFGMGQPPVSGTSGLAYAMASPNLGKGAVSPAVNGNVAPIGARRPSTSQSSRTDDATSSLASLNLGSSPARPQHVSEIGAIGAGHGRKPSNDFSGPPKFGTPMAVKPRPIGRPKTDDLDVDAATSSSASLRSPSPPPMLGSAALLEEDLDIPDVSSTSFPSASQYGTSWGAAESSGIWGVPGSTTAPSSQWKAPTPPPMPAVAASSPARTPELERADIIRARTGIACIQLSDTTGRPFHPVQDIFRILLGTYPDAASVDIQELVASCQMPANGRNGGGRFEFDSHGDAFIMRFVQY